MNSQLLQALACTLTGQTTKSRKIESFKQRRLTPNYCIFFALFNLATVLITNRVQGREHEIFGRMEILGEAWVSYETERGFIEQARSGDIESLAIVAKTGQPVICNSEEQISSIPRFEVQELLHSNAKLLDNWKLHYEPEAKSKFEPALKDADVQSLYSVFWNYPETIWSDKARKLVAILAKDRGLTELAGVMSHREPIDVEYWLKNFVFTPKVTQQNKIWQNIAFHELIHRYSVHELNTVLSQGHLAKYPCHSLAPLHALDDYLITKVLNQSYTLYDDSDFDYHWIKATLPTFLDSFLERAKTSVNSVPTANLKKFVAYLKRIDLIYKLETLQFTATKILDRLLSSQKPLAEDEAGLWVQLIDQFRENRLVNSLELHLEQIALQDFPESIQLTCLDVLKRFLTTKGESYYSTLSQLVQKRTSARITGSAVEELIQGRQFGLLLRKDLEFILQSESIDHRLVALEYLQLQGYDIDQVILHLSAFNQEGWTAREKVARFLSNGLHVKSDHDSVAIQTWVMKWLKEEEYAAARLNLNFAAGRLKLDQQIDLWTEETITNHSAVSPEILKNALEVAFLRNTLKKKHLTSLEEIYHYHNQTLQGILASHIFKIEDSTSHLMSILKKSNELETATIVDSINRNFSSGSRHHASFFREILKSSDDTLIRSVLASLDKRGFADIVEDVHEELFQIASRSNSPLKIRTQMTLSHHTERLWDQYWKCALAANNNDQKREILAILSLSSSSGLSIAKDDLLQMINQTELPEDIKASAVRVLCIHSYYIGGHRDFELIRTEINKIQDFALKDSLLELVNTQEDMSFYDE